jgi:hypothetical protein
MNPSAFSWVLAACSALLVGVSKTGVPGLGILMVPLMAMVFPAKLSVGALLPMLLTGDVFAVAYYRQHAQWRRLLELFPCVLVGIGIGTFVLSRTDSAQLKPFLGYFVLALLALELARKRFGWTTVPNQWWFVVLMGSLAGFATTVGNLAGPVMNIYLVSRGLLKNQFMGTTAWYFLIINACKVPIFWKLDMITADTLHFDLVMVPMIVLGALAGKWALPKIPQIFFNSIVLLLAAIAAFILIFG